MKFNTKNPYIIALITALVVGAIQLLGVYLLFKESAPSVSRDVFFANFSFDHNRGAFIAINLLVALAIIAIGYIYAAYFKKPHIESRFSFVALISSVLLALISVLTSIFIMAVPAHSLTFFEIVVSIVRNFVIITACLNIGELIHSFFQKAKHKA